MGFDRPAQPCFAAAGACGMVAAAGELARHVVARGFEGPRHFGHRRSGHQAVADHDARAAGALDAAIQRCVGLFESRNGASALVLQVEQAEALGLVVGDSLQ